MKILRDYQQAAHDAFVKWWRAPEMEALVAATVGMGKTTIAAACVDTLLKVLNPSSRVLWLTHREELIEQSSAELQEYIGLPCGIEKAERYASGDERIVVASVQTLHAKRLSALAERFQPDLIVADEAHRSLAVSWMGVKQTFDKAKVLNLTATPYRADVGNRLDLGVVLAEHNTSDGIRRGILVPPKPVGKIELDLGDVKKRLGDYDVKTLSEFLCRTEIMDACMDIVKQHAHGKRSILFAASVEHGKMVSERLRAAGFRVGEVYGTTPTEERESYYKAIKEGQLDVLTNNLCLDSKTEVLTRDGWKCYNTISKDDLVANWEDEKIWFSKPNDIIVRQRKKDEKMAVLRTRQKSMRVTYGHRMLVKGPGKCKHVESQHLIGKQWDYPVSGMADPFDVSLPAIPPVKSSYSRRKDGLVYNLVHRDGLSRDEAYKEADQLIASRFELQFRRPKDLTISDCRFIGFWVGGGGSDKLQSGGIEHKIYQGDRWPNVVKWVSKLVKTLGVDYIHKKKHPKNCKTPMHRWSFSRGTGWGPQKRRGLFYLEPYLTKGPNQLWWNFNEEQFAAFLEGYWFADGNHKNLEEQPKWFEIRGTRKALFDHIQAIAVCRGYKVSLRKDAKDCWILTLVKRRFVHVSKSHAMKWDESSPADETVWCVATESTNIITRRDGYVSVMGNCLTEGFNLPCLEMVIMLRPTRNAALYIQCLGRGLRVDPENPDKKCCFLVDIIDIAKRPTGKARVLPTKDDVRLHEALVGHKSSEVQVFLSWFYQATEIPDVVDGKIQLTDCLKLKTSDQLYDLTKPSWLIRAQRLNPKFAGAEKMFDPIWTPEGTYRQLFQPFRIADADAFCLYMGRKGWIYLPHNQLPEDVEILTGGIEMEDESNFNIDVLIGSDASLRNFVLDLFDTKQSLREQASKYYDVFEVQGQEIAWFKVLQDLPCKFHFIQWQNDDGFLLARAESGAIYLFRRQQKGKWMPQPGAILGLDELPAFVMGTSWEKRKMSAGQKPHVARILGLPESELDKANISALSASVLMSNSWFKSQLETISRMLQAQPIPLAPATIKKSLDERKAVKDTRFEFTDSKQQPESQPAPRPAPQPWTRPEPKPSTPSTPSTTSTPSTPSTTPTTPTTPTTSGPKRTVAEQLDYLDRLVLPNSAFGEPEEVVKLRQNGHAVAHLGSGRYRVDNKIDIWPSTRTVGIISLQKYGKYFGSNREDILDAVQKLRAR